MLTMEVTLWAGHDMLADIRDNSTGGGEQQVNGHDEGTQWRKTQR
jgi:hypothetical protein